MCKELTIKKLRKYCDNLLSQYFIILKLKNTMVNKRQRQSFKANLSFKKTKNKKKPEQKCQNWAFKKTKRKRKRKRKPEQNKSVKR